VARIHDRPAALGTAAMLARRQYSIGAARAASLASLTTVARAVLAETVYLVTLVREPNPCPRHGEQRRLVIKRLDLLRQAKTLFGVSPELRWTILHLNFLPIAEGSFKVQREPGVPRSCTSRSGDEVVIRSMAGTFPAPKRLGRWWVSSF
jgi:hypothetical protein